MSTTNFSNILIPESVESFQNNETRINVSVALRNHRQAFQAVFLSRSWNYEYHKPASAYQKKVLPQISSPSKFLYTCIGSHL